MITAARFPWLACFLRRDTGKLCTPRFGIRRYKQFCNLDQVLDCTTIRPAGDQNHVRPEFADALDLLEVFPAIINSDFLREVDFFTGAFPANRGNVLSSVLDMKLIDGNPDKMVYRTTIGASEFGASLSGPIGEKTTMLFSARRSYLDLIFKAAGFGFVPESIKNRGQLKQILDPDIVLFAEIGDRPIGFSMALPDINQALRPLRGRLFPLGWLRLLRNLKKIDAIRVTLMGVLKEYRHLGIDLAFYKMTAENAYRHGITKAEMSWILESNEPMNRVLRHINARVTKTYAIQAGRELRVIVGAEKVSDKDTESLSFEIARKIQNEMTYPGQIKITVIRETRAVNYAK